MTTRAPSVVAWIGASLLVVACTTLPDIPRGTCGNHVVEAGEDCDTNLVGADKSVCRAPGQVDACRFDCSVAADGSRTPCPSGSACGQDGVCRTAKGEFSTITSQIPSGATGVGLSDYDGDGLQDVREVSNVDIRIRYGDPAGDLTQTFLISAPNAHPAAGVLTTDPLLDLAFSSAGAIAVWRGATNRTMSPTTYPSIPIPTTLPVAFLATEVLRKRAGLEVVTLIPDTKATSILGVRGGDELDGTAITTLFALKQPPANLVFPLKAAQLDEDPVTSPCDEILLAFKSSSEVQLFPTYRGDIANTGPAGAQKTLPSVVVPGNRIVSNVIVRDLNFDGHLDILILVDENGLFVALGGGDGTFSPPVEALDLEASNLTPIDVGYLTDDTILDFVTPTGLVLITPPPTKASGDAGDGGLAPVGDAGANDVTIVPAPTGVDWSEATVLDLNGDGLLDVVATSPHRLDVLVNSGSRLFDPHPYRLDGTPSLLAFGDFDGDHVMDMAFRERFDDKSADSLTVGFGTTGGVPLAPVSQGRIGTISVLSAGPLSADVATVAADGLADIGALATSLDGKVQFVSVLAGSPDRLLQSPFVLTRSKGVGTKGVSASDALSFAVGQFTSDTHPDLAVIAVEAETANVETHAWLVPVTGDATIDVTTVTAGAAVDTFTVDAISRVQTQGLAWLDPRAEMIAIDLDAAPAGSGGLDEVVVLTSPVEESQGPGAIFVLNVVSGAFNVVSRTPIGKDSPGGAPWSLKKADIDLDGAPDLLVTFHDDAGMHAQVYFNKRNGALDTNPIVVAIPTGANLQAWAPLNADADPQKEIAMLTDKGVFLANLIAGGASFTVAPKPLAGVPATGTVLACGDIDGDGIDDIAIAGAGVLQVFRGLAVLP